MTTPNELTVQDTVVGSDRFVIYSAVNGQTRTVTGTAVSGFANSADTGKVNRTGDTMSGALNVPAAAFGTQVPQAQEVVNAAALAASSGSSLVGHIAAGAGGVATTVQAVLRERISVFRFMSAGVIADIQARGKTLDAGAGINLAIAAATVLGQGLFFPSGTYNLLTHVPMAANTDWEGEGGTVIYLNPAMTQGTVIGGTARAVYADSVANVALSKIKFNSVKTGLTKANTICFNAVTRLRIADCAFEDMGDATYYVQGAIVFNSTDVRITNNRFHNVSGDGLAFSNNVTNFCVSGNSFTSNADWGFAISIACTQGTVQGNTFVSNTSTATGVDRCTNIAFVGNTMVSNEHGVRVAKFAATADVNRNISIIGNNIITSGVAGIAVEDMGALGICTVSGNTINGSSNQGILVANSELASIVGNTIYSCVAEAILFNATTAATVTGNATVIGNKIQTCTYGVRQITGAGTTAKITVVGNDISSASVAPTSLYAASDYIDGSNPNYLDYSKVPNFPSGVVSATATGGGIAPPANVWQFMPVYFGGTLKKIPVYNA